MEKSNALRAVGLGWILTLLLASSSPAQWGGETEERPTDCSALQTVDLGLEFRAEDLEADQDACFLLEVPTPGWLVLMTSVPLPSALEPEVVPLDPSCPGAASFRLGDLVTRQQSFEIRQPGSFGFCLRSEDPRKRLSGIWILALLREHAGLADDAGWLVAPDKGGDPEEEEVEPPSQGGMVVFPGADPRDPWDDHGNYPGLATPIQAPTVFTGNLESSWNVDSDLFLLEVAAPIKIEVSMVATEPVRFLLEDHRGTRLRSTGALARDGVRWFKNLEPGHYYLRVDGLPGSRAEYQIEIEASDPISAWTESSGSE